MRKALVCGGGGFIGSQSLAPRALGVAAGKKRRLLCAAKSPKPGMEITWRYEGMASKGKRMPG